MKDGFEPGPVILVIGVLVAVLLVFAAVETPIPGCAEGYVQITDKNYKRVCVNGYLPSKGKP